MARKQGARDKIQFEQEYAFKNVELFKKETLGAGSYGAVCKAKCDQLMCAAKLIYSVLFQIADPAPGKEHRHPRQRFELECRFLSLINHPNIIQYLGTYRDPETDNPVLLMELMDESLTHYLESSPGDIPYHIQVNLASDIAQALAFLHANGIIHRDLSSNNVLLLAGRAKLSDFGMSKFDSHLNSMTKCPGTPVFMPPEALSKSPEYTEKIDNFSLGVITVQILTRKYPNPTDAFIDKELVDPDYPTRKLQAKLAVPEVERRQEHISLIDILHPLLATAIDCLADKGTERPTSQDLCQRFAKLKEQQKYMDSSQKDKDELLREKCEQIAEQQRVIAAQEKELKETCNRLKKTRGVQGSHTQDNALTQLAEKKDRQLEVIAENVQIKDEQLQSKDTEIQRLRAQVEEQQRRLTMTECSQARMTAEKAASQEQAEAKVHTLEKELSSKDAEVNELRAQLARTSHTQSEEPLRKSSTPPRASNTPSSTPGTTPGSTPAGTPIANRKRQWKRPVPSAPAILKAGSTATNGNCAYFRGAGSNLVYMFDALARRWQCLGHHPLYGFTLIAIEDKLASVGGYDRGESSSKIYDLVEKNWVESLPEMPVKRDRPAAVYTSGHLIVMGGCDNQSEPLKSVNILELETKQWTKATNLPFPVYHASATVCNDKVYLTAGDGIQDANAFAVLSYNVAALLQTKKSLSKLKRALHSSQAKWQAVSNLPVRQSCLVKANDELLAVGGLGHSEANSRNVFKYNSSNNAWEETSEMVIARSSCMAAVFWDCMLLAVGGQKVSTKDVDAINL